MALVDRIGARSYVLALTAAAGCTGDDGGATSTGTSSGAASSSTSAGATATATTDETSPATTTATDTTTTPTTSTASTSDTSSGTTASATSTTDGSTTADTSSGTTTGGVALLFDCHGCGCDAATHYCVTVQGGVVPGLLPGDLPPCPDVVDPYLDGCHPFPAPCVDDPTCACLGDIPGCFCEEQPDHAHVTCPLP